MEKVYKWIKEECLKATTKDPIELCIQLMKNECISIHGPEHHILDGSCFLAALHNAGVEFDLAEALEEMAVRGSKMPGATCGNWGICGSAASVGAALAIVHGTGPLSNNQYYKDNMLLTSHALARIAEIGGPRCCKRNAFVSLSTAVEFANAQYGLEIPTHKPVCTFSHLNKQCKGKDCPFWTGDVVHEEV